MQDIASDLQRFDADYKPDAGFRPRFDVVLGDGEYLFVVEDAILDRMPNSRDPIMRVGLRVEGGMVVDKTWFLSRQEDVNRLGADLVSLGLSEFASTRQFSKTIMSALAKLKGIRFRGRKVTETGKDQKQYVKLYILGHAGESRAKPPSVAAQAQPSSQQPAKSTDEVPF